MSNILPNIPFMDIMAISAILLVAAVLILNSKKITIAKTAWLFILAGSAVATFASLLINNQRASGTGWRIQSGWPHFFYSSWKSFEDATSIQGFMTGQSCSYIIVNLLFYFSVIFLIVATIKFFIKNKS